MLSGFAATIDAYHEVVDAWVSAFKSSVTVCKWCDDSPIYDWMSATRKELVSKGDLSALQVWDVTADLAQNSPFMLKLKSAYNSLPLDDSGPGTLISDIGTRI